MSHLQVQPLDTVHPFIGTTSKEMPFLIVLHVFGKLISLNLCSRLFPKVFTADNEISSLLKATVKVSRGTSGFLTCGTVKLCYSPISQAPVAFVYRFASRQESNWMTQRETFIKVNFPDTKPVIDVMTGLITAALTFLLRSRHIE